MSGGAPQTAPGTASRPQEPRRHASGGVLPGAERSLQIEYAIRDVALPARELEAQGHEILKLNIGDPIPYGFGPPQHVVDALCQAARDNQNGYTASEGDPVLVDAIVRRERRRNGVDYASEDVVVGTGVTECLQMLLGASVVPGDEVLIPGPAYPPYDSLVKYFGGKPVHYRTDEAQDWQPDLDDVRAKITSRTKAVCLINPNNPTGALYDDKVVKAFTDVVAENPQAFLVSDEIYDEMTFDGTQTATASLARDVPMVTLNGFSKVYLVPGWRLGHMLWQDPDGRLAQIKEGVLKAARNRLSASSIAQRAAAAALDGPQDHIAHVNATLRKRRDFTVKRLNEIEGVSSARPDGAFYAFPRIDALADARGDGTGEPGDSDPGPPDSGAGTSGGGPARAKGVPWTTDKEFVLDLLREEKVLTVHGSGFDPVYGKDHFRMVILPETAILETALGRLESFLKRRLA